MSEFSLCFLLHMLLTIKMMYILYFSKFIYTACIHEQQQLIANKRQGRKKKRIHTLLGKDSTIQWLQLIERLVKLMNNKA